MHMYVNVHVCVCFCAAANAAIQLNGIQLGSEPLKITASNSAIASSVQAKINSSSIPEERKDSIKRTIYVGSVDVTLTEAELKHHFEVYVGPVVRAVLAGDKVGCSVLYVFLIPFRYSFQGRRDRVMTVGTTTCEFFRGMTFVCVCVCSLCLVVSGGGMPFWFLL